MLSLLAASILTAPPTLYTVNGKSLSPAERVVAQCIQGLTSKAEAHVWIENDGMSALILDELREEGHPIAKAGDVWALLKKFPEAFKGAIVYKLGDHSLNVATGLCGPMKAIAIDESLLDEAKKNGLKILLDTRGMTEKAAYEKYRSLYRGGIVVEQSIDKPGHLRDFAIKHSAFVMDTDDREFRKRVVRDAGPRALVFGWGKDEYDWITDVSAAGGTGIAADWCVNLSALESLPVSVPKPPAQKKIEVEDGVRYVAFVLSDGDNFQWVTGGFAVESKYYGSPLRGQFPMSWEMAPLLAQFAPRVLRYLYRTAKPTDDFVTGPGLPGYTFPNLQPDRVALAKSTAPSLRASGMRMLSFLNQNDGSMSDVFPWLDLSEADAAIYKDYSPYHRRRGEMVWHGDKPVVAYRFLLWPGIMDIDQFLQEVAKMPTEPRTKAASYALVNVHAWSFNNIGGPIPAVKAAIDKLPPNTRVVTATQLLQLLKENHPKD